MSSPHGAVQEALWRHLTVLAEEIGPRVLGTANDRRAADYIEAQFKAAGLEVARDVYPCPSWDHQSTRLCLLPGHSLDGLANMFSPAGNVTADLALIQPRLTDFRSLEDFGSLRGLEGKAVLAPDIPGGVLEHNALAERLEDLGAAALIGVSSFQTLAQTKFFRTPNLKRMPVLCVPRTTGVRLIGHVGDRVRLEIQCERFDSESYNIIARKPGRASQRGAAGRSPTGVPDPPTHGSAGNPWHPTADEGSVIVVGAHYDTAPLTPGAGDNGSGTATLIELARTLAAEETTHPFEFVAFGGEEYGGTDGIGEGARQYARLHEDHFQDVKAMFAIDGVGNVLGSPVLHYDATVPGSKAAAELAADDPMLSLDGHLSGASDHVVFWKRGVPAMWLASADTGGPFHTPADDLTQVRPDGLEAALDAALRLCRALDAGGPL